MYRHESLELKLTAPSHISKGMHHLVKLVRPHAHKALAIQHALHTDLELLLVISRIQLSAALTIAAMDAILQN